MRRILDYSSGVQSDGIPAWGIASFSIGCVGILLSATALLRWHGLLERVISGLIAVAAAGIGFAISIFGLVLAARGMRRSESRVMLAVLGLILNAGTVITFFILICTVLSTAWGI